MTRLKPIWRCVLLVLVGVLGARHALALRPCEVPGDIAAVSLRKPLEFQLTLNADADRVLQSLKGDAIVVSKGAPQVPVPMGLGGTWLLADEKASPICQLDLARLWKKKPPNPASIGVSGEKVPGRVLAKVLGAAGALTFRFSATPAHRAGVQTCPNGLDREWKSGEDLQLQAPPPAGVAPGSPSSLWVRWGDGNQCFLVGALVPDHRKLSIEIGAEGRRLLGSYTVATLAELQTPTTADGHCRVQIGNASTGCDTRELAELVDNPIDHRRWQVFLRVLPALPLDKRCPTELPESTDTQPVLGEAAYACVYAKTGNNGHELVDAAAAASRFGDFSLDVCRVVAGGCEAAAPAEGGLWRMGIGSGEPGEIALRVSSHSTRQSAVFESVRLKTKVALPDERIFAPGDVVPAVAECLPAFADDEGALRTALTAVSGTGTISTWAPSRIEGTDTELLCPVASTADGGGRTPRPFRDTTTVEFRIGAEKYLTRTLVSASKLTIASVVPYEGSDAAPTSPALEFDVTGARTVRAGRWLCLDISDSAVTADVKHIQMAPGRLAFRGDGSGPLRVNWRTPFVELYFDRVHTSAARDLFCTRFDPNNLSVDIEDRAVPESLFVSDDTCPCAASEAGCAPAPCLHRLGRSRSFANVHFNIGAATEARYSLDGAIRSGIKVNFPVFDLGYRMGRLVLLAHGGFSAGFSWPSPDGPPFDDAEASHPPGTCVAGCDDVYRTSGTLSLGAFLGPCVTFLYISPNGFIAACAGVQAEILWDARAGSGVFAQPDGTFIKVGERYDWRIHPDASFYWSLGWLLRFGDL